MSSLALRLAEKLFRPGCSSAHDVRLDVLWLIGLGMVFIATGIGLRDPWPVDEPRFALIARDMVATGEWLIPRIGGDVYAEKPPFYFWWMAFWLQIVGSLRIGFLLPSVLSGLGCLVLVYDLARRLWSRETGLVAGLALLFTAQFVWQARQAQIDATLCFLTTLGLYGLLRHLLQGPQWRWYCIGWAAAGLGTITKGVGFLPLLVLIPYALLHSAAWSPRFPARATPKWLLGPLAFVAAVSLWLVPVLSAAKADPQIAAYLDEMLFKQTFDRYLNAWHHREPFWYFAVEVIPGMWLPLTALLPWIVPQWRRAWRARDLRIALLLIWILSVVAFFSFSTGKRGVYVLPAVPALALACAPYLRDVASRAGAQRLLFFLSAALACAVTIAVFYALANEGRRTEMIVETGIDPVPALVTIAIATVAICAIARPRHGFAAFGGIVVFLLLIVSFWLNPAMNAVRSGQAFVRRIEEAADPNSPLGLVGFKEQYLLQIDRPIVHFGQGRWRELGQETMDGARWLAEAPDRQLVVVAASLALCFQEAERTPLGRANRSDWYLVRGHADPRCVEQGNAIEYRYLPPTLPIRR